MDETIRRRAVVSGRVQGVFFRDSIRQQAADHGVAGWAANRADGTVEAVLEGSAQAVASVLRFLEHGPPRARVDGVVVEDQPPQGLAGFKIR
jgi:acylphosphatase